MPDLGDGTLVAETASPKASCGCSPHADEPAVFVRGAGRGLPGGPAVVVPLRVRAGPPARLRLPRRPLDARPVRRELSAGDRLGVVISTEEPRGRDAFALFEKERKRREKVLAGLPKPLQEDELARQLALAGDGFLVRRGREQRAVVAGYPWFGERSRDAMIALPGLCLVTGRFDDARKILRAAAKALDGGLFPERDETEASVDAPLWFFVAGWSTSRRRRRGLRARGPAAGRAADRPGVQKGHAPRIGVDADGLLLAADPEVALTWMDGRDSARPAGDAAPGKPVEVEALWVNALSILAELEKRARRCRTRRSAARRRPSGRRSASRRLFWNEAPGLLFDAVDGERRDEALRPNQVFALSLPFPLLPKAKAERVLAAVERGLCDAGRAAQPGAGRPRLPSALQGDPVDRELAYHQGTVWSWLLGPYLTALVRVTARRAGRRRWRRSRRCGPGWPRRASARSPRSSTPTLRTRRAAASPAP